MKIPPLISLLLLAIACSQPSSTETFLRGPGPYEFALDLSDSTAVWDVSFYTRVDAPDAPPEMGLCATWTSPSAESFTDTVYLPLSAGTSFFSQEACVPYRSGVSPAERGHWTLTVDVPEPPSGLRGLGLVMTRLERK
ncbi:MAG: hypothetical protein IK008_07035 [Bacteroidales bacterium]|nr:hypothetical protein [Bacteroidales bacterium]